VRARNRVVPVPERVSTRRNGSTGTKLTGSDDGAVSGSAGGFADSGADVSTANDQVVEPPF